MIGAGATGKVYHAHDSFSGQEVAVKLVNPDILHDPEFNEGCRNQFLNEASLVGKLAHPHIVTILEASVTEAFGYIVMEYVPGGNLWKHTDTDKLLPLGDALQIIFKCCGALDYAFRQDIIHRDIKPANIMIVSGTNIKISDFGAAVFYQSQITQEVVIGSPHYMSIEQINGKHLSHLSDMYSLGVTAYELLTGTLPYQASNISELFRVIGSGNALPPSSHRSELPKELDEIILRMIAIKPEDRFPDWADVALEIARVGRFSKFQQGIADSEKFGMLCSMESMGEFTEPEIWELIQASKWASVPARTVVLCEDETGQSMYLLVSGQIKAIKQGRLLNVINAGEYFGEMAYIQRKTKRQATLETISDAIIAEFSFEALETLTPSCSAAFSKNLLRSMAERLALAGDRIVRMHG